MPDQLQHEEEGLRCSFCDAALSAVVKMISAPRDYPRAYICDECIRSLNRKLGDIPGPAKRCGVNDPGCSFCHKGPDRFILIPSPGDPPKALICEECLAVCIFILEDDSWETAN
jgi:hypothetical protein